VIVTGHQWWWEVEYPSAGVVTANELHLPVGRKVHLQIESADVIHDFWVPALSRKIDMVPGRENHLFFEVERTGRYDGVCAEFCGSQHGWMRFDVFVHEPTDFEAWLAGQAKSAKAPSRDPARAGLEIYLRETCDRCHTLRGAPTDAPPIDIGPDLTHFASRRLLGAGVLENDRDNLYEWLKNPQAIKEGCHMPNFQLSDDDAAALAAYLSGLP
jgi:cytochrome c oxidase subunit 2